MGEKSLFFVWKFTFHFFILLPLPLLNRPSKKAKEKQIEKRDCFEIHGASQVPTVPFGFPFIPSPSSPLLYAPLLFVKEITFFPFSTKFSFRAFLFSFNSIFMSIFMWAGEGENRRWGTGNLSSIIRA